MKLKVLIASIVIPVSSAANVHAECLRETSGETICGAGPCANDRSGRVFCATERFGSAMRDREGEVVCGLGRCTRDLTGQITCSREVGGDAVRGIDGVKCFGGCEIATPAYCERVRVE
jgi:uncharacterized low-complexity protein